MSTININFDEQIGKIKPMHAVNNDPAKDPGETCG